MKYYVIKGYEEIADDYYDWVEKVYLNKEKAEKFLEEYNKEIKQIKKDFEKCEDCSERIYCLSKEDFDSGNFKPGCSNDDIWYDDIMRRCYCDNDERYKVVFEATLHEYDTEDE